jgi:hypothetical protein
MPRLPEKAVHIGLNQLVMRLFVQIGMRAGGILFDKGGRIKWSKCSVERGDKMDVFVPCCQRADDFPGAGIRC